jgi:hypothetical protein
VRFSFFFGGAKMSYRYFHIASAGNLPVASGPSELGIVNVNAGAASAVLTVYDNTAGSGTVVAVVDASVEGSYGYGVYCSRGIYAVLSGGNADCTVTAT